MIKIMDWGQRIRYEEPRPVYLNKDNIGDMAECHKEDGDFTVICTNSSAFLVKETPEEILAMPDIESSGNVIDWERRRYEIAKQMLPTIYEIAFEANDDMIPRELVAEDAVKYTDVLIDKLKKGQDNEYRVQNI